MVYDHQRRVHSESVGHDEGDFTLFGYSFALAVISSVALLASDSKILQVPGRRAALISALPLLAVGFSFLILQPILRPKWAELFKNLLLAATFLLWGAVQLMTQNLASKTLGDVVIALYVTDLACTPPQG